MSTRPRSCLGDVVTNAADPVCDRLGGGRIVSRISVVSGPVLFTHNVFWISTALEGTVTGP